MHPLRLLAILLCVAPAIASAATQNKDAVAVIIGNKAYQHGDVPEVSFAHRDAEAIKSYVIDILGFRERNVIDLRDATSAQMDAAFGSERSHKGGIWRMNREGKSDIVVYYSGHGMPGLSDGKGYLLPSDVAPTDAEIGGYPLEVLYANLQKLKARSVLVLLDACFSGTSHGGSLVPAGSGITLAPKNAPAPPRGLTVLTAAASNQIASWDVKAKHGLFTEHFLRAVYGAADDKQAGGNGDGQVTVAEVKAHLDEEMTYVAKRTFGREQVASVTGSTGRVLSIFPAGHPPDRAGHPSDAAQRSRLEQEQESGPNLKDLEKKDQQEQVRLALSPLDLKYMQKTMQQSLERVPSGSVSSWRNPNSSNSGTITPHNIIYQKAYGMYCREFRETATVSGRTIEAFGTACRQPDGTWKVVNN